MKLVLSQAADDDLLRLYLDGAAKFGIAQADAYSERLQRTLDLLADNPLIARERTGFKPPVRCHPHGGHVIVYRIVGDSVLILRIRHGRENWSMDPAGPPPEGDDASPDPESPDPPSPDPASPDPASPDPASPDPASPDPASQDRDGPNPAKPAG